MKEYEMSEYAQERRDKRLDSARATLLAGVNQKTLMSKAVIAEMACFLLGNIISDDEGDSAIIERAKQVVETLAEDTRLSAYIAVMLSGFIAESIDMMKLRQSVEDHEPRCNCAGCVECRRMCGCKKCRRSLRQYEKTSERARFLVENI